MDTIKAVIFTACIVGVITSLTDIAAPEGSLKKQLRSVLAVILVLAVITPIMGQGFKVTLSDYTELSDLPEFDNISTVTELYYLSESESRLEEYFGDKLNKNGIENVRVDITANINEYNEIEITKVRAYSMQTSDRELIKKLISEDLPEAEVIIQEE
ncbi:hypothetical protein [uncultured Ruminococcus sp.]|uniref:hypothetical protein n=1 Tax=uncultured Ruminococcus sp. TaxID=165186 RepID=UPI0025FE9C6A|nr:hypothetical protein [uncultured Ruminococcus sp.]